MSARDCRPGLVKVSPRPCQMTRGRFGELSEEEEGLVGEIGDVKTEGVRKARERRMSRKRIIVELCKRGMGERSMWMYGDVDEDRDEDGDED